MMNKAWIVCAALAACGGNSGGGGGGGNCPPFETNCHTTGGGPDAPGVNVQYQAFTPKTRSVGDAIGTYQLAISDGTGGTACGLSSDKGNSLGVEGHEVLAALTEGASSCAVGTYSFGADCPADPGPEPAVPYHCAYFRLFDATGKSSGFLPATAGSVTVSGDYTACTFNVNLSFSGTQFNDQFTLVNSTGTMPWCTP